MPREPDLFPNEKKETKNVSMLYDDALPESIAKQHRRASVKPRISVGRDDVVLSPYVIHLSTDETETAHAAPNLDALAQQLVGAAESLEDHEKRPAADLQLDFDDVSEQLAQPDLQTTSPKGFRITRPVEPTATQDTPVVLNVRRKERVNVSHAVLPFDEEGTPTHQQAAQHSAEKPLEAPSVLAFDEAVHAQELTEQEEAYTHRKERRALIKLDFAFLPTFAQGHIRAVAVFATLSLALILPLHALQGIASSGDAQAEITTAGQQALDNFLRAQTALQADKFDVASSDFNRASENFAEAEETLKNLNLAVATVVNVMPQTDRTYDSVRGLVTAGRSLSSAASALSFAAEDITQQKSTNVVTKLRQLSSYVEAALPNVREAESALEKIDPEVIPDEYAGVVTQLQERTPAVRASMEEFLTFADALAIVLGENEKTRYLVAFQNNTELRATGGFIGSFAEMDVLNGNIENIHIPAGGTYDVQGQLSSFVYAPKPLSLINARWEFHDANWFPDFPTSAKKMLDFYEAAGGPTVDGVMTINASLIPDLLAILGPIEMPAYERTINAENFLFETQKIVELEYEDFQRNDEREEDAPKQFIGDLAPLLLERMKEADVEQMLAIADVLGSGLYQKDVQLFFTDNDLQSQMESLGWAGKQKQTSGDYLMVVNTNLGGGKTDSVIDQNIDVDVDIAKNGTITNTVTITKQHRGLRSTLFEGVNNVDYLRLYVPRGSRLLQAEGFEVPPEYLFETSDVPLTADEDIALLAESFSQDPVSQTDIWDENGKTVFGNWMQTSPGETEQVTFIYELPFTFKTGSENPTLLELAKSHLGFKQLENYTLLVQKQPGVETRATNVRVDLPENSEIIWSSHTETHDQETIKISNTHDFFLRFLVENRLN